MFADNILKNEEKAIFSLRALYKLYGYLPFKMSKFEEYDLYVRNKDFLIGDSVITFNDTNGKLLALKPDVTLSIIKNSFDEEGCKQKVYYNENVYRVSSGTHQFKEIMQTGVECIGDIDIFDMFEVTYLAAKSLATVSSDFVLDISDMGIFNAIFENISQDNAFRGEAARLIAEKNKHELTSLCSSYSVSDKNKEKLLSLVEIYGGIDEVLPKLAAVCEFENEANAFSQFSELCNLFDKTEFKDKIKIDFSVISNSSYYNGVVFKGFLNGICESVLSGGRYDPLMRRMGRKSSAIGFALYVDLLEGLDGDKSEFDVDVLIVYSDKTEAETLFEVKERFVKSGKSISVQKKIPSKLRYKEIFYVDKEGVK